MSQSAEDRSNQTMVSKGELTSLDYLDGKYRSMAAEQLSAAVLEAANKARAEMARRVVDLLDPQGLLSKVTEQINILKMPQMNALDAIDAHGR